MSCSSILKRFNQTGFVRERNLNKLLKTETQLVSTNFVRLLNPLFLSWSFLKLSSFKFKLY